MRVRGLLRYLWAAPCTLVGLLLALAVLAAGGSLRRIDGVLEVALPRTLRRRRLAGAITFGHVVLGSDSDTLAQLRAHEHVHVQQYERWGVLFFLAYPLASLWQWLRGRRPYWHNPFEVDARRRSRTGRDDIDPT